MTQTNTPTSFVDRSCPICDSREAKQFAAANFDLSRLDTFGFASRKLPEFMHYRLAECKACDLIFSSPAPSPESLQQAYHDASFDTSKESEYAAQTYGRYVKRFVPKLAGCDGALDIGTGDGAFLKQLLSLGFSGVQGIEPSAAPVNAADPEVRPLIRHASFVASDFQPEQFRLVTCFQTLEHVFEPLQLCRDVYRITKPGGAFFTVCHNRRSLLSTLLRTKSPIFDIEHLQLFSPASAKALLERAGFKRVEVFYVVNRYPVSYWAKLIPAPLPAKHALLKLLNSTGVGKINLAAPAGNLAAIAYRE